MKSRTLHAVLLALLLLASARGGDAAESTEASLPAPAAPASASLDLKVMSRPWAVKGSDGRQHIVYELMVSNVTGRTIRLDHVAVLDADGGRILSYTSRDIRQRFQIGPGRDDLGRQLRPAESGVLFVHVALRPSRKTPKAISHRLEVTPGPSNGADAPHPVVVNGGQSLITTRPPVELGPPLRGRNYVAADSCCDTIRHVRALLLLDGRLWLAQRFAIDWEQIDNGNRIFVGDHRNVHSYHIYGDEVLAVADGEIVAARDGMSDQIPHEPEAVSVEDADGNHILQDIGNGAHVLYAHMKKGSVRSRVKVGQKVRKGQVIGLVGNTGNTIAPHLHLHVTDAPSALEADGIPYVFERFRLTGFDALGTVDFDKGERFGTPLSITPVVPPSSHRGELPLDLVIVDWLQQ